MVNTDISLCVYERIKRLNGYCIYENESSKSRKNKS